MIVVNRYALRVTFVSFVVIVAIIIVTFALQGLCEMVYVYHQPISQIRKRILIDQDDSIDCDVMFVVRGRSNFGNREKLTKIYNCSKLASYALQPMNDYECMFYAMLTNPNCKGYLFLGPEDKLWEKMGNLLQNDRNRIWYKGKTNTKRLEVSFNNKHLFRSNEITICKKAFKELALLNLGFNNYAKRSNGSWHRPWNVEIALNALLWNGKGKFVCFYKEVETFYVPVKYRESFLGVASIFSKVKMPDDIAVPTLLKSLDLESTFIDNKI